MSVFTVLAPLPMYYLQETCKWLCKAEVCLECNAQCVEHVIKLLPSYRSLHDGYRCHVQIQTCLHMQVYPWNVSPAGGMFRNINFFTWFGMLTVDTAGYKCAHCNKTASNENNLKRHEKEYHYETKTNLDFVEDMDESKLIMCEQYGFYFKGEL